MTEHREHGYQLSNTIVISDETVAGKSGAMAAHLLNIVNDFQHRRGMQQRCSCGVSCKFPSVWWQRDVDVEAR